MEQPNQLEATPSPRRRRSREPDSTTLSIPHHPKRYASRSRSVERSKTCRNCAAVDFHHIIDKHGPTIQLCSLHEAAQNAAFCVFCNRIVEFAIDAFGNLETALESGLICTLRRRLIDSEDYLETSGIAPYARLMVILRHQCYPVESCDGERCAGNQFELTSSSLLLDRVGLPPGYKNDLKPGPMVMIRKPVGQAFDADMLLDWLKESERRAQKLSSSTQTPPSLNVLLQQRRLRVIDVRKNTVVALKSVERYIALSYVWGKGLNHYRATNEFSMRPQLTTSRGSEALIDAIIPPTIKDAIEFVRSLGERYLWVDAFCIDQSDAIDKGIIISQMGAIFAGAYLTIVAAEGDSADCRLSRLSSSDSQDGLCERPVTFVSQGKPISLLAPRKGLNQILPHTTWSTRGWTLQEYLMSPRRVIFTEEEVFYKDESNSISESYETLSSHWKNDDAVAPGIIVNRPTTALEVLSDGGAGRSNTYSKLVYEFTCRQLTHGGDRLDAFIGIMARLQPWITDPSHLAAMNGLPQRNFAAALFRWVNEEQNGLPDSPIARRQRYDARGAKCLPSWSWVGWCGTINNSWTDEAGFALPLVIDPANIVLPCLQPPADWEPVLYKITHPLETVLHLWVQTAPCTIQRRANFHGVPRYKVFVEEPYIDSPEEIFDGLQKEFLCLEELDEGPHYELMTLASQREQRIVVDKRHDPTEVIAVVKMLCTSSYTFKLVPKYVRLR